MEGIANRTRPELNRPRCDIAEGKLSRWHFSLSAKIPQYFYVLALRAINLVVKSTSVDTPPAMIRPVITSIYFFIALFPTMTALLQLWPSGHSRMPSIFTNIIFNRCLPYRPKDALSFVELQSWLYAVAFYLLLRLPVGLDSLSYSCPFQNRRHRSVRLRIILWRGL